MGQMPLVAADECQLSKSRIESAEIPPILSFDGRRLFVPPLRILTASQAALAVFLAATMLLQDGCNTTHRTIRHRLRRENARAGQAENGDRQKKCSEEARCEFHRSLENRHPERDGAVCAAPYFTLGRPGCSLRTTKSRQYAVSTPIRAPRNRPLTRRERCRRQNLSAAVRDRHCEPRGAMTAAPCDLALVRPPAADYFPGGSAVADGPDQRAYRRWDLVAAGA